MWSAGTRAYDGTRVSPSETTSYPRLAHDIPVTVLDVPVVGRDRDDTWAAVEGLRGRPSTAAFVARTHAGSVARHRERYAALAERGVSTVFVGVRGLGSPDQVLALAGLAP